MTVTQEPAASTAVQPEQRRGLRSLLTATWVSSLGDGAFTTAAPLLAAVLTKSPAAVAAVAAAEMLPWLLVTPFAGALVDRWPSRPVLVVADGLRAVALAVLALLVFTGHASIPALATVACLAMAGMTFHDTALQRSTLELAGREETILNRWNGRIGSAVTAGKELLGQPAGSGAFALAHWAPFLGDALSFAGSAALMAGLPSTARPEPTEAPESLLRQIAAGARWLARHRVLRAYCLLITTANLAYSAAMATFVLYATKVLHVSTAGYGLLMAAGAVGGIAGGMTSAKVIARIGDHATMALSVLAQALAFGGVALTSNAYAAGLALAVAAYGTALATVVSIGTRQRLTPTDAYGRVTAIFRTFGVGALPVGSAVGGVAATVAGLHAPLVLAAALLLVVLLTWAATGGLAQRTKEV